jgi:hypothetical protein
MLGYQITGSVILYTFMIMLLSIEITLMDVQRTVSTLYVE